MLVSLGRIHEKTSDWSIGESPRWLRVCDDTVKGQEM